MDHRAVDPRAIDDVRAGRTQGACTGAGTPTPTMMNSFFSSVMVLLLTRYLLAAFMNSHREECQ